MCGSLTTVWVFSFLLSYLLFCVSPVLHLGTLPLLLPGSLLLALISFMSLHLFLLAPILLWLYVLISWLSSFLSLLLSFGSWIPLLCIKSCCCGFSIYQCHKKQIQAATSGGRKKPTDTERWKFHTTPCRHHQIFLLCLNFFFFYSSLLIHRENVFLSYLCSAELESCIIWSLLISVLSLTWEKPSSDSNSNIGHKLRPKVQKVLQMCSAADWLSFFAERWRKYFK